MANFLTILDNNEAPLGYLTKAKNVEIRERLNGESLLSFELAYDTDEASHVNLENYIKDDRGQLFVIKEIEQSDNGKRSLIVRAVHVYIELVDEYIDRTVELFGVSANTALSEALQGTEFVIGSADSTDTHDIDLTEMNVMKAVQEIRKTWNLDLWFDNRTVYLGDKTVSTDKEIRYGKNFKSLQKPQSSRNVITRLYPYGKDGLTVESVNGGVKYIDSANISNYRRPKIAEKNWREISDPQELLNKAQRYLEEKDDIEMSYAVDFFELSKLGYTSNDIAIGEVITLTHLPFNFTTVGTKVVECVRFPFESKMGHVVLSSFAESPIDDVVELKKRQNEFDRYSVKISKTPATYIVADGATSHNVNKADFVVPSGSNATATIQEAIDRLPTRGGKVVLLEGDYYIDSAVNLKSNITVEGQGESTKIVASSNASYITIFNISNATNVTVKSLLIDGIDEKHTDYNVYMYNSSNCKIKSLKSVNAYAGIYSDNSNDNFLTQNTLSGNRVGIYLSYSNNNDVTSNNANNHWADGIYTTKSDSNNILNNICNTNKTRGIFVDYGNNCSINSNICNNNEYEGIKLQGSSHNTVNGNSLEGNGQTGDNYDSNIYLTYISSTEGSDYNNIQANVCRKGSGTSPPEYGVVVNYYCKYNIVTNNDLHDSGSSGSILDNGDYTVTTAGNRL